MYIYSAFAVALLLVLAACGGGGSGGNGDNNLSGGGSSSSGSSGGSSSSGGVVAGNCPQCVTNNVTATNIPNLVTQLQNSYPGSISTSNATLLSQYEYTELAAYPSDTNAVSLFNGTWNQYFDDDYNNYPGECYVLETAVTKNGYCSALGAPTTAIATLVFSNMKQTAENGGDFSDTDLTNGLTAQGQFKLYIGFLPGTDGPSTTASGNVEQDLSH